MYVSKAKFTNNSFELNFAKEESKNVFIGLTNATFLNCKFSDDLK